MSLGGGSHGIQDLLSMAVDNADLAGMVVAVAAGNDGPGFGTVSSPGLAPRALTAGATTVPHFVGAPLTISSGSLGLASGEFKIVEANLTGTLGAVLATPGPLGLACATLPAGSLANKIAVISRGSCTFSTKIRNAQTAGAIAVVIVNNVAGDPVAMAQDGTANQPTIPAYMASLAKRGDLVAANGGSATIGKTLQYFLTTNVDIRAGFSSEGPTDVDFRVKPDVMAPGVNVLSAQPKTACAAPPCWAFFQGTSMATPHLAGSAAVVISQHPTWMPAAVRSAIVNTAEEGKVTSHTNGTTVLTNVNIIGGGRENLASAVAAKVALDPVSLSFGSTPSGSGQSLTKTIALTNLATAGPITVSVTNQSGSGVTFGASYANGTITVTMSAVKGIAAGNRQGILRVSAGGTEVAHAALYALIK
jgi:subtilisin family serine protease